MLLSLHIHSSVLVSSSAVSRNHIYNLEVRRWWFKVRLEEKHKTLSEK
jgi:hypothetical protein